MIFFGTSGAKQLRSQMIEPSECPHCGAQNSLASHVYGQYFHVWWIPFFSLGKKSKVDCQNCLKEIHPKNLDLVAKEHLQREKMAHRTPIWYYSGLGLVAILITFGVITAMMESKATAKYIKAPQEGDVYEIEMENGRYSLFRVEVVSQDSLYILMNEYETTASSNLDELNIEENYDQTMYSIGRDRVNEMYEEGKILNINR